MKNKIIAMLSLIFLSMSALSAAAGNDVIHNYEGPGNNSTLYLAYAHMKSLQANIPLNPLQKRGFDVINNTYLRQEDNIHKEAFVGVSINYPPIDISSAQIAELFTFLNCK